MAKVARLHASVQDKVEEAAKSASCSVGAGPTSMEGSVGNASKSTQAAGTLDASDVALNAETEDPAEEKGPSSCNRVSWPNAVTSSLIRIWEDYYPKLNSNTENTSLYEEMAAKLNAGLSPGEALYTANQVLVKINRLKKRYWKEKRTGCARGGSSGREWSIRLHSFLGSLPASDDDQLVDQNVENTPALAPRLRQRLPWHQIPKRGTLASNDSKKNRAARSLHRRDADFDPWSLSRQLTFSFPH
ncbi:hypothetical protein HPB49_002265 [Dermacentor silvarum]|uniref:Uncharacterized protein n=1 Tax=Dermacentor silvarum TaxID=543639 RepID=A0ACB8CP46_DERSI|nr:hypothetical protein HPB49_002265 [Dermacentor silvarum]